MAEVYDVSKADLSGQHAGLAQNTLPLFAAADENMLVSDLARDG